MKRKNIIQTLRVAFTAMLLVFIGVFMAACKPEEKPKSYPETGVYRCYDVGDETAALTLSDGTNFVLVVSGETQSGTYKLTDLTLVLTYSDNTQITAAFNDTVITMNYNNVLMSFYKEVSYTVTYEVSGGSAVSAVSAMNGKTIAKPEDPTRNGYEFIGWYTDSDFKTPFMFGTQKIVADTTLYARWEVSDPNAVEVEISFDLGYQDVADPASITTIDGKLYNINMPAPVREGYTFGGWAVSMYDDGSKPSYMFKDAMTVKENTTFHAIWVAKDASKLATPVVNVETNAVTWNPIAGVSSYRVEVTGPEGFNAINTTTGSTMYNVAFGDAPAGEYVVKVTAVASDVAKNSETAVRYYINKALTRVSHFAVNGTVVTFNAIENVTNYLITVDCGDSNHNHTNVDLGTATSYDFANCLQQDGGILFTVTSTAEGYYPMTSRTFSYKKDIGAVEGLSVDETTGTVNWNAVEGAEKYVVSVKCGNVAHKHDNVYVDGTSFSVKECEMLNGGIVINVYAVKEGYNSPAPTQITYDKSILATPSVVCIDGTTMTWNAVNGATSYKVKIGNVEISVTTNSIELSTQQIQWVEEADYVVSLQALGANGAASLWSDDIDARYYAMYTSIEYNKGVVSWNHVIGATSYEVRVNGDNENIIPVDNGANSTPVVLTKAGLNQIDVRYLGGTVPSGWVSTTVTAYAVNFDTMVSGTAFPTQYKAVGDPTDSFDGSALKKSGYTFYGWYKTNAVGAGNAALYTDGYFRATSDITLYADYTPRTYEITYNYAGGTGEPQTVKVTYGQPFTMVAPTLPSDATKAFGGWYSAPEGTGTEFTDEYGMSLAPWNIAVEELPGQTMTVYAFWKSMVLDFQMTKVGSQDVYAVSKGAKIGSVSEVTIPQTYRGIPVKAILGNAFIDCTKLVKINIPNTVELIAAAPNSPFSGCTLLQEVNIIPVEGNNAIRYWSEGGILFDNGPIDEPQPTELAYFPLGYTNKSTSYTMSDGVEVIPYQVFSEIPLEKITISATVTLIENEAFYKCRQLKEVNFAVSEDPSAYLTIEKNAFYSCRALETVNLPSHLAAIALMKYYVYGENSSIPPYEDVKTNDAAFVENAFYDCDNMKAINVAEGNEVYASKDGIVYSADMTSIVYVPTKATFDNGVFNISSDVSRIEPGAFIEAYELKEVFIPNTVTYIGEYAFYFCNSLSKVTFGGNGFEPVTIDRYAFSTCENIQTLIFEEGSQITEINDNAFMMNVQIRTLEIPATVRYIGSSAFRDWTKLSSVTFKSATTEDAYLEFGAYVFYNTIISTLTIPAHVTDLGGILSGLTNLSAVYVDENNEVYMSDEEGILFDKEQTAIIYYPMGKRDATYKIPETVGEIGSAVFSSNRYLTSIEIGKNITTIGDYAFYKCSALNTVTFEDGGEEPLYIGEAAFQSCNKIRSLTLPDRTEYCGAFAFSYMNQLTSLTLNEGLTAISDYGISANPNLTMVHVPSTVEMIGYYGISDNKKLTQVVFDRTDDTLALTELCPWALSGNAIASIEIPNTVITIGENCFNAGEASALSSVTFEENSQLELIAPYAFASAKKLTTIEIPNSVTTIAPYAFHLSGLKTITFEEGGSESLTIGAAYDGESGGQYGYTFVGTKLTAVDFPARLTEIGVYVFNNVKTLTSVTFAPEGQTSSLLQIGNYAFSNTGLTSVTIPKSVTNLSVVSTGWDKFNRTAIGEFAFAYCASLAEVKFEVGGTTDLSLGRGAFQDCTALTSITLPSRLATYVDRRNVERSPLGATDAFAGCTNLTQVNIDTTDNTANNVYVSEDGIVYSKDMKTLVYVPKGRTASVDIPKEVTLIEKSAFELCAKLTGITFEAGGTDALVIGEKAFSGCAALSSVVFDARVTTLGASAFENCTNLQSVELSADLTEFNATVFAGCEGLKAVSILDNDKYVSVDGVLFDANQEVLYYYPLSKTQEVYTVPNTVKTINQYAFYYNTSLKEVILPDSLNAIGDRAFYRANIEKINIPKNVTKIGDFAFCYCTKLTQLNFAQDGSAPLDIGNADYLGQSSVTSSSTSYGYAFAYCYSLTTVQLPERTQNIADLTFSTCRGLQSITIPASVTGLGNGAFYRCERLESVEFAEGTLLEQIPYYAFANCYSLQSFELPASVVGFGVGNIDSASYAFYNCESMTSFSFGESNVEVIPYSLFANCSSLQSIEIPASVVEICSDSDTNTPFMNCSSLSTVTFAEGSALEFLPDYLFKGCGLTSFEVPETVTYLGGYLFWDCDKLESIVIPDGVQLSYYLFYDCSALTEVTLPSDLTYVPEGLFQNCSSLSEIDLPDTVDTIDGLAFSGTAITSFTMPEKVAYVAWNLFAYCKELTEVVLHDQITEIHYGAFVGCLKLKSMEIPDSVIYMDYDLFSMCKSLESVKLPSNSQVTMFPGGMFYGCDSLETVEIPEGYTCLDWSAFYCSGIREVIIPNTVTIIYDGAFSDCPNLERIVIPASVTYLGGYTFYNCSSLETVEFEEGSQLKEIGFDVFSETPSLKSIVIPEGVTTIWAGAFFNSGIESISLPASLTALGLGSEDWGYAEFNAFASCTNLKEITIDPANDSFVVEDNILWDKAKTEIYFVMPTYTNKFVLSDNVTIKDGALTAAGCVEVVLDSKMTEIPYRMFFGAKNIKKVVIPEGIISIGTQAFMGSGITSVEIPASVVDIGSNDMYAYGETFKDCKDLKTVTFAEGSERLALGWYTFAGCTSLETITIPSRVRALEDNTSSTAIPEAAFMDCTSLRSVIFEENPEEGALGGAFNVGTRAFQNCIALTEIRFPQAFGNAANSNSAFTLAGAAVGESAFENCENLTTVTFPENGNNIAFRMFAFANCVKLENFAFPSTTHYLGACVLMNTAITSITVPASVTLFDRTQVTTAYDEFGNPIDTRYYNGALFINCTKLQTAVFEGKLTNVNYMYVDEMFSGCSALTSVEFRGDGLTKFGAKMFDGCTSLASVTIPASVTSMEAYAFEGFAGTVNVNRTVGVANEWSIYWNRNSAANFVYL